MANSDAEKSILELDVRVDDLADVIYTSGSTGKPKVLKSVAVPYLTCCARCSGSQDAAKRTDCLLLQPSLSTLRPWSCSCRCCVAYDGRGPDTRGQESGLAARVDSAPQHHHDAGHTHNLADAAGRWLARRAPSL